MAALVVTLCEVMAPTAAHADEEVILETPPVAPGGNSVIVVQDITLSDPITVLNPGTTLATQQQCTNGVSTGSFCLGTSDVLYTPDLQERLDWEPKIVSGVPASPYRLPGSAMDFIVDEAETYVAVTKGLQSDDLVRTYARADLRAYIIARLEQILNKKLYGEPMTDQEVAAYEELQAIKKDRLVKSAKWALEEYGLWSADPCGYVAPSPPVGSTLPAVPNPARDSSLCSSGGGRFSVWQITDGTPPADVFDRWAAYRHPTPGMKVSGDTKYHFAMAQTAGAYTLAAGYAGALTLGGLAFLAVMGISPLAAAVLGSVLGWSATAFAGAGFGIIATLAAAVASAVVAFVGALVTIGVAVWQMIEDAKPGADLRDRAARAAANDDPLRVEAAMPDYAGLSFADVEEPADPAKEAYIHSEEWQKDLFQLVHDWQMFGHDGTFIPDPVSGYNPAGTTTDADLRFAENGTPRESIVVLAPPETRNVNGELLSGYQVKISRGFLMVAELVTGEQTFRPYQPRTSLKFVDATGPGIMSLMQVGQEDGPPIRKFLITRIDGDEATYSSETSWTYFQNPGVPKTVTLLDQLPVTPQVNVIPSVQGELVADHLVTLKANASDPALTRTGGQYTWVVERLDDNGDVVETIPPPGGNLTGFQHRFEEPGRYRAKVTLSWTGPDSGSASGRVEFTIIRPAAEVLTAEIEDDRVDDGSLTLNLRLLQNTRGDGPSDEPEFDVEVDWADDGLGNVVTEHYDVRCVDTGFTTCDTGPLIDQPSGGPTNDQWSSSPTFQVPDDQNFLPHVTVRITNSYGETITRIFPIEGEHRPKYADMTPYVEMPAGTFSRVDVVQVIPSDLFPPPSTPGFEQIQIQPFLEGMIEQLPPGVTPDLDHKENGEWWLQLRGEPTADAIGQWTFYFPFEQVVDDGNYRRPAPALTTLEVVSSTSPGYRGIIRGAPHDLSDRVYRTAYPDWMVQAAERRPGDEGEFTDFAGTVKCKLEAGGQVVFDKPCTANGPFPWPQQVVLGSQFASVYLESDTQPVSADGPYTVNLIGNFLDPTVTLEPVERGDITAAVKLRIDDVMAPIGVVPPPFSAAGYTVTCSLDSGPFSPCLDSGEGTVPSSPGNHTLDVKVVAPDDATVVRRVTWNGGPKLSLGVTARPTTASALKAGFDLALGYGGLVAPTYAAKGFDVKCVNDGKAVACDSGSLALLRVPGKHVLMVTAKAPAPDAQTVTAKHAWSVGTPKKKLTVNAPATGARGTKIRVRAKGLLPRENFVIKLAGNRVATGKANASGKVSKSILLPRKLGLGRVKVVVRGATAKRTGQDVVRVVNGRALGRGRTLDVVAG